MSESQKRYLDALDELRACRSEIDFVAGIIHEAAEERMPGIWDRLEILQAREHTLKAIAIKSAVESDRI